MSVNKATDAILRAGGMIVARSTTASFTVGVEGANAINVAFQIKNVLGANITAPLALEWYLASNATGLTKAPSAPNGGTAIGTNGQLFEWTAELAGMIVTNATGAADINITDSGTPTFYLVIVLPNKTLAISGAITFA